MFVLLQELLGSGTAVRVRVTGRSMAPCLADGDVVMLIPVDPKHIRLGDLVFCREPGCSARLHRVVGRSRGSAGERVFHTKGDALLGTDPPVRADWVLGRVAEISRGDSNTSDVIRANRCRRVLDIAVALASRYAPRTFAALAHRAPTSWCFR